MDKILRNALILGILLISFSMTYYFWFFLPSQSQPQKREDLTELKVIENKKEALKNFYNELAQAIKEGDYEKVYDLNLPSSIKKYLTKEQFVSYSQLVEKNKGKETNINSITVDGDSGFVDRTIIYCKTEECLEEDQFEDSYIKEYQYKNGRWQVLDIDPTERALTASTSFLNDLVSKIKEEDKNQFLMKYSYNTGSYPLAIRIFALELDNNLQQLINVEQTLEKLKNAKETSASNSHAYQAPSTSNDEDSLEIYLKQSEQKRAQECQEDIAKYNTCLAKYNTDLAEYNACLNEGDSYCRRPFEMCIKPYCSY